VTISRIAGWLAATAFGAALAPPIDPWVDAPLHPVLLGLASGVALFAMLARRRIRLAAVASLPPAGGAARGLVLTARAGYEEAVWRGLVLGLLMGPVGRAGALAASTLLFAGGHLRRQGPRAAVHVATGSVFGLAYVLTGRLSAAIASHAAYNVLVGTGRMTSPDVSVSATSGGRAGVIPSPGAPFRRPFRTTRRSTVPSPTVARLEAVSKSFGRVCALEQVDLELREGEVLGLLGRNGAGKSTAISLLLGLRRPDAGRAVLYGRDPRDPTARRRIGVVLQEISLPPVLRVGELLDLVRAHFSDALPRDELLERFDLAEAGRRQIGALSGGERRRLALAAAMAGRPRALFLDEPSAAIDVQGRQLLWEELSAFVRGGGAVLLTTQQLEEAERYATRVVLIARGRVAGEGSVDDLRARVGRTRVSLRAERPPPLPPSASISSTLDRHVIHVDDAEAFVRELVRSGLPYHDLEVMRPTLEDAFVELTESDR
jgi:ABC-2 type transport system ATP-binding protein